MVKCMHCGKEIRYITAAPSVGDNGIIPVDLEEQELITEKGRIVRGFKVHICPSPPKPAMYRDPLEYGV
jgi:hypothetical protein